MKSLELQFGAQDVRVLEELTVWSGHYSMRRLTLQHRRFAGGWSDPVIREVFERGDAVAVLPYDPATDSLVLIEQFRPGVMARLGIDYEALRRVNPQLIYCAVTGYGQTIAENFLHLLENFANSNAPINPTRGQIWFNSDPEILSLQIWDGSS